MRRAVKRVCLLLLLIMLFCFLIKALGIFKPTEKAEDNNSAVKDMLAAPQIFIDYDGGYMWVCHELHQDVDDEPVMCDVYVDDVYVCTVSSVLLDVVENEDIGGYNFLGGYDVMEFGILDDGNYHKIVAVAKKADYEDSAHSLPAYVGYVNGCWDFGHDALDDNGVVCLFEGEMITSQERIDLPSPLSLGLYYCVYY